MERLTIGKMNGMRQLADQNGMLTILALDHRRAIADIVNPTDPGAVRYETMVELKKEMAGILGPLASAVLLDPTYGAAQCIAGGVLRKETGLVVCLEAEGFRGTTTARVSGLMAGWSVAKTKRMGASAVKLLVYYRRTERTVAGRQMALVRRVAEQCRRYDLPAIVEALTYPLTRETHADFAEQRARVVVESAEDLTPMPIDVFKAEFPGDIRVDRDDVLLLARCQQLDAAIRVPWLLLSGGMDFDDFRRALEIACRAGASGFLAGRAIWHDAVAIRDAGERIRFLETAAADRMRRLVDVVATYGRPWKAKFGSLGDDLVVDQSWHANYRAF